VREHALGQLRLLSAAISRSKDRSQCQTAQPIAAALVTKHIAPAARARTAAVSVAAVRNGSSTRNDHGARAARNACFQRNQRVVDDNRAGALADALENAADDLCVAHAVDASHSKQIATGGGPPSIALAMMSCRTFSTSSSPAD
jgi:hypothetical protein